MKAVLYSAIKPSKDILDKFKAFLNKKYGELDLAWEQTDLKNGFKLVVGDDAYYWDPSSKLDQLKQEWNKVKNTKSDNIIPLLQDSLDKWTPSALAKEVGRVLSVGDGIAKVSGLNQVKYGEILLFTDNIRGMVLDLKKDYISCILFGDDRNIIQGSVVKRTGREAGIPVGDKYLGRVVNALGNPIDELGPIEAKGFRPLEEPAPSIMERSPVNKPLQTGILAIDSMFPIGRGQRELIIGDRQTGKTAIALDTILNQKGKNVICIYVAIGQKASSVAGIVEKLKKNDALKYSVVVSATASESAPLQYIAPYSACSLGEYFMRQGKDVLIVYDDLSKHAIAYRALSLLLERSPGREAYPGDVFYLHSRLLERSANLLNGGSISALPIVETQAGDVSAYIPTNIISITDGQIFLESNLFNLGQRPAINIGLSVSRVGGDAQSKAMKKAAGSIRLDLAQYREMEVFMQFSSDLDDGTKKQLHYGQILMELLKQEQYHPYQMHEQVIILVCALNHLFDGFELNEIKAVKNSLLEYFNKSESTITRQIEDSGILDDKLRQDIVDKASEFLNGKH